MIWSRSSLIQKTNVPCESHHVPYYGVAGSLKDQKSISIACSRWLWCFWSTKIYVPSQSSNTVPCPAPTRRSCSLGSHSYSIIRPKPTPISMGFYTGIVKSIIPPISNTERSVEFLDHDLKNQWMIEGKDWFKDLLCFLVGSPRLEFFVLRSSDPAVVKFLEMKPHRQTPQKMTRDDLWIPKIQNKKKEFINHLVPQDFHSDHLQSQNCSMRMRNYPTQSCDGFKILGEIPDLDFESTPRSGWVFVKFEIM